MRLLEKSTARNIFDSLKESEEFPLNKDDEGFNETVLRDFRLFLMDKYGDELYQDVTDEDVNEYFTGMFYDIWDNDDFDTANAAEDIIRAEYHVPDKSDFNESEDSERILAKLVKDLPDTVEYKGKTYQAFNVMSNDTTGATSKVYYCNMENTPNGDPQESNDYFFVVATLKKTDRGYKGVDHINYVEDLTEGVSNRKHITERASNKYKVRESEEQKPNYVMFYLNGKELGGHDLANEFEGERESARELFAYENNVKPEEIEVREVYRESESKKRYAYDIDWETDGDEEAKKELPTKVRIPEDIDKDSVADWLSDKYGWLVNSVSLEESLKEATDEEYEEYMKREKERAKEGYKDICSHITDSQREKFNGLKEMLTNKANGTMDVDGWYFATDAVYAVNNSGSGHHLNPYMDLTTSNVLLMVGENNSIEEAIKELFDEYKPDSAYSWADNFLYALDKVNLNAYQEFIDEQTMEDEMYENAVNELVSWMYDNFPDNSFYKEGTLGNGDVVYYFDVKKGNVDEIKEAVKAKFGDEVSFGTARTEYAPEMREFVIICKKKKRNINESKKPKKEKKEDKRVVMQQGNVTCFKENDSTYYVFENESDNEVEYDNEEAAMQDFLERVGIDPNNELTESVKLNEANE